jgi:hypothetical protein
MGNLLARKLVAIKQALTQRRIQMEVLSIVTPLNRASVLFGQELG